MRTYEYILAMKEETQAMELDSSDDSDFSSDESEDFDSTETPTLVSKFLCKRQRANQVRIILIALECIVILRCHPEFI